MSKLFGNRYQLGALIGAGGMADVFAATDTRLSREVAIKVLRSDLSKESSFITRFKKEALAAAGLSHPGIVAVYDSGDEPAPYIVMELVSGETLREVIQREVAIEPRRALEITAGILAALNYSHTNGIVHRDIKPANIMITKSGDVKVMDFGIARALDDMSATMTATWNVIGTAQYLSPEQAMGESADARSDLYSVGCVLYEMLTGKAPFTGDTPVSIAFQHVSGEYIPASKLMSELPEGIDHFLAVVMSKKAENRYQDAQSMAADLARLRSGQTITTEIVRPKKKRKWQWVAALVAVLMTFAGTFLFTSQVASGGLEVPNVIGLTEGDARGLLNDFNVVISHSHNSLIPVDRIASQSPLATTKVKPGSSVEITISDGPGDAIVPMELIGKSLVDARAEVVAAGLLVTGIESVSSDQTAGTVLGVRPEGGSTLPAGSGVILQVANGTVKVPNLIGQSAIQARATLTQAGFLIKEIFDFDKNQPVDLVIAQAPPADSAQGIGSQVTITINRQ